MEKRPQGAFHPYGKIYAQTLGEQDGCWSPKQALSDRPLVFCWQIIKQSSRHPSEDHHIVGPRPAAFVSIHDSFVPKRKCLAFSAMPLMSRRNALHHSRIVRGDGY
jgi:hypothetical protein